MVIPVLTRTPCVENKEIRYFANLERRMYMINPRKASRKMQVTDEGDFPFTLLDSSAKSGALFLPSTRVRESVMLLLSNPHHTFSDNRK